MKRTPSALSSERISASVRSGAEKSVNTVASRDQVEPAIELIVLRGLRKEVDAVTDTGSFGRTTRLPNGLSIRIKADDFALGKGLGDGNPNPSDAASNIQYPTALLKSRGDRTR